MRPTIVLLSPTGDHQELVNRLRGAGSYRDDKFFDHLDRGKFRFGVDISGGVINEFDEEELAEISEKLGEFRRSSSSTPIWHASVDSGGAVGACDGNVSG